MRIFVAYGYNERDQWVEELVFPIIQAFGADVVTGEELQGEQITDAVKAEIERCDGLIAFATRREEPYAEGKWRTHRWVTDEIAHALALKLPIAEVREQGVDDQGGIAGDRQRIVYDEKARDKCLVEIAKTIGRWHRRIPVRLQLLPEDIAEQIFPIHRHPGFRCTYRLMVDDMENAEVPAQIVPIKGGLFVLAKGVPRGALIQIHIEYQGKAWTSTYESIDSLSIRLRQFS